MKKYFSHGKNSTNFYTLSEWLEAFEPFEVSTGNFRGGEWSPTRGRLHNYPEDYKEYTDRGYAGMIDFVVYSYSTPIVWHDKEKGWIDPGHGYTQTTKAKHYGPTRTALSVLER